MGDAALQQTEAPPSSPQAPLALGEDPAPCIMVLHNPGLRVACSKVSAEILTHNAILPYDILICPA